MPAISPLPPFVEYPQPCGRQPGALPPDARLAGRGMFIDPTSRAHPSESVRRQTPITLPDAPQILICGEVRDLVGKLAEPLFDPVDILGDLPGVGADGGDG